MGDIFITQTIIIRKFIQKKSLEVSNDLVTECYIMSRAKGKKVSKKAKAMPASKKRALLNGKKGNDKSNGTVSKANEVMDKFLNEVSKKLEKGPVAKDNPSPKQLKGSRKRASGRKKARKGPSRANTMKTTQGAGAQVKGGNDAKSGNSVDSKAKKTAGTRKGSKSGNATQSKYAEVDSDFDDEENEEEVEGESEVGSDWEEPEEELESDNGSDDKNYSPKQGSVKRKAKPSKGKAKKKKTNKTASKKSSATANKDLSEDEFDEEETETESEEEAENDDNDYSPKQGPKKKKLKRKASKKKGKATKPKQTETPAKKEKIPPVSEMVIDSIKALGANPKKGSNLRSIKTTILLNWTINMNMYKNKIKKFIQGAIEKGEIIRVSGNGFNGRFTVPGMKMKKKKKSNKLGKKFDEDEAEYAPKRTKRDDGREESKVAIEKEREKRKVLEEKLMKEKESRPKKKVVRKKVWEVEAIKGIKDKNHEKYYLVKWKGFAKLNWEPAENVKDCDNLIDAYVDATKIKEEEQAKWKRLAEKGTFEPERILDVKTVKGKRQFLIRWKGHGQDSDKWELESKLNCKLMIEKFMMNHEKELQRTNNTREMREAPKRSDRFVFASSKRVAKRSGGLGISYAGMDED